MFFPVWARARGGKAARFVGPALILLNLSLFGCGVPLAASELTATAEVGVLNRDASGSASEASSRAAPTGDQPAVAFLVAGATPPSTIAPLRTITPDPSTTVTAARTPGITPSPAATASPAATTTSTTPSPSPSPSAQPSGTVSPVPSGSSEATPTPGPTSTPSTDSGASALSVLNAYRVANGRPPLVGNATLTAAANAYAQLMGKTNTFGHTGPDGSVAETRIAAVGYKGKFKGEALAAGQTTADAAAKVWIASPAHNAIISDPTAIEVGIGYAYAPGSYYSHYWVLITGVP